LPIAPVPAVAAAPYAPPLPPSTQPLTDIETDHGRAADRVGPGSLLPLALVAAAAPTSYASAASALSGGAERLPPLLLPSMAAAATPGPRFPCPPPQQHTRGRRPLGPPLGGLLLAPPWRHDASALWADANGTSRMARLAETTPPLPPPTLLTPAAPPPHLPSRQSTRVGGSRRKQPR